MSRTYRLRHLPKLGAKKFVDADIHKKYYKEVEQIKEEFDLSWTEAWHQVTHIDLADVANPKCHPWVGFRGQGSAAKTYYLKQGQRQFRRHQKHTIRHLLKWHHFGDADACTKSFRSILYYVDRWSWT